MTTAAPALALTALSFSYPRRADVLRAINLTVWPGERVGLIGPNGAGKTTLFLLAGGVLKPTAGRATLFGAPVVPGRFRPEVGLVFQNPDDQLFSPSLWDDVAFGPQNLGLTPTAVRARVEEALAVVGLSALAARPPHHLSGGEKRMAAIAAVLAMHPQLVLYDEPSANLDIRSRRRLIRFLQQAPQAMLIAAHDLELILEVCARVVVLDEGRIVADGDSRQVMGDEELMEAHGLEKPHSLVFHAEPHH